MFEEIKEKYTLSDECIGELEKVLQSETDKVRTKYSAQLKELEQYKPKEKTEEQLEFERTKNELAEMKFKESIRNAGLDSEMAKYLKPDTDLEAFGKLLKGVEQTKQDYTPKNHSGDAGLTKDQFENMSYDQKAKLYSENPTLYAQLKR
ncbi:MAG: hypothetical protein PUK80_05310 [Firmicutes bacterium]|nr:hypothetical protein [Bacillota bacterium]